MKEIALRQQFDTVKAAYAGKGRAPVITPSDLKFIVPVVAGKTNYSFPVLVGEDPNNYPEAILLNRADAFIGTELGIFIGKKSSTSDTTYDVYSYPNTTEFSTDADAFKTLFNHGLVNMAINNVQYLQNFSILRNRRAQTTQTGLTYGYTTSGATAPNGVDSFNGENDGFYPLVPTLQLSGTSKIDITVSLPAALAAAGSGTYVIIVAVRGFLALGASNLNK